ncbi:MAG: hypothetical protein ACRYFS_08195 [Janthinobacterium lividum]
MIKTAGSASIAVFTAGPGGSTSAARTLSIVNLSPVLTSLGQTQIASGLSSLSLTLNGSNFLPGTTVLLGTCSAAVPHLPGGPSLTVRLLP